MALCLNIFVAYAQKENPRGTYKMTKLTGRGGVEIDAPFDQYKICEEGMTISVFVRPTSEDEAECNFVINDPIVFNYTGLAPQGGICMVHIFITSIFTNEVVEVIPIKECYQLSEDVLVLIHMQTILAAKIQNQVR